MHCKPISWMSFLGLMAISIGAAAEEVPFSENIKMAQHALIQGDSSEALALLEQHNSKVHFELNALELLLLLEQGKTDTAEDKLVEFESHFATRPETFAFSAEVWRNLGHQASLFWKRGYYKKAVAARIHAGTIGAELPEYLTLKASAVGQGRSYGGKAGQQEILTKKILSLDMKWGFIAQLNLAQNIDDEQLGEKVMEAALGQYGQDFDVLERIAQYHWTMGDYQAAQHSFLMACLHLPEQPGWFKQVKWHNACYRVAVFAQEEGQSKSKAIKALHTLLATYTLPTQFNFDIADLLSELTTTEGAAPANAFYKKVIEISDNKALVDKAVTALERMSTQK